MARRLGEITPFIGGAEYAHLLIPIFETLCNIEETVVRSSATTSASKILSILQDGQSTTAQGFLNLLKRLCAEDVNEIFYSKVSACQLIDEIYRLCVTDRSMIHEIYSTLCRDEMTIVRRAAAIAFPKILKHVEGTSQATEYFELLKSFSSSDEHLTVRTLIVQSFLFYSQQVSKNNVITSILEELVPLIKSAADDNSWKIRLSIVKDFGLFVNCFTRETILAEIFPSFLHLIQDSEADVRSLACDSAVHFIDLIGIDLFLTEIIPIALQLSQDATPAVRKSLADMSIDIAVKMNNSDLVTQHLNDLIMKLLTDEDPSVKIRILSKIDNLAQALPSFLQHLTPTLKILYSDDNWRVRKQITLAIPSIMRSLGIDYFTENYLNKYLEIFKDSVAEVRIANASTLPLLVHAITTQQQLHNSNTTNTNTTNSSQWIYDKIFPLLKSMSTEEYMYRITMLISFKYLILGSSELLSERLYGEIINLLLTLSSDIVPNVRLATAVIMGEAIQKLNPNNIQNNQQIIAQIKPVLQDLSTDKDKDVKYFAIESMKLCN
jgi:serine/threonine-protein phosphatase 2A regulatory subunit A